MKITLFSDPHTKHAQVEKDLPGGDVLICAGDIAGAGYKHEIQNFCHWFDSIKNYDHKIFIAGNRDRYFEDNPKEAREILKQYPSITYLEDDLYVILENDDYSKNIKIWGTPWQPDFFNWAFNLPRNSEIMKSKWDMIPNDIDILVTHGPPHGILDLSSYGNEHCGDELLKDTILEKKPKIQVFGHVHSDYGYTFNENTHFFNASMLSEGYYYRNKPFNIDFDKESGKLTFLNED